MSIRITKHENNKPNIKNIKIKKVENTNNVINDDDSILTPLYGKIKVGTYVDPEKYTYFDTMGEYDLFISNDGNDTMAIKSGESDIKLEDKQETNIDNLLSSIRNKYDLDTDSVIWSDSENAIMINSSDPEIIKSIYADYNNNEEYTPELITDDVLFLNKIGDIKLEDNTPLDKLSDQDMKNVIQKTGIKLNGTENRERLKGMIQGVLSNTSK